MPIDSASMAPRHATPRLAVASATIALAVLIAGTGAGTAGEPRVGSAAQPERREPTVDLIKTLKLPPGFAINVFARGLEHPRMLLVTDDGSVLVTRPQQNDVLRLRDTDGDGVADKPERIVKDLEMVHGIALRDGQLYLASPKAVYVTPLDGGQDARPHPIIQNLPDGGQHPNRTLGFGPDGALYVTVGSDCNDCKETNPENATVLRADPKTGERRIFARGLRNTIGFGWHPKTKELFGMDHGSDWRGNDLPPEELNHLQDGKDYGWPYVYGKRVIDQVSDDPPGTTKAAYAAKTEPSALEYQAHSAPIGMVFYTGSQFPPDYQGDAFVAFHGSWNRDPPTGYKVVRIRFDDGRPVGFQDFVTGFLAPDGKSQFGRPAGIAVAKDGSLLFSDDSNGVIYRVTYRKESP
jgi:glucose/arabinose dehydrogenase